MERQPQNPEFKINPVNFHPCKSHRKQGKSNELTYLHGHRLCSLHTPEGDLTHPCPA